MDYEFTHYGDIKFNLSYEDWELKEKIISIISTSNDYIITPDYIARKLLEIAFDENRENRVISAESNTIYPQAYLTDQQLGKVSRIIWDLIIEGKIMYDFFTKEFKLLT